MIKFRTYSQEKQGQKIGSFYLYSPEELLKDVKEKEYLEVYGGFAVWNMMGQGLVAEKFPHNDNIGEGGLYIDEVSSNLENYFKIDDSPKAYRTAWFKTREGAERFLEKYGKVFPGGVCLGLWAPTTMIFNE